MIIEHDISEEEKASKVHIGCEISEQLEFKPGGLFVLQHRRHKYAPADDQQSNTGAQIVIADKPPQPIDKGLAGPGLLAYVITSKLGDHLSLYRLETIFARQKMQIARSTMCAWMATAAILAKPLVDLMTQRVRSSRVIHTDDPRVPVQDPQVKGKCKSGLIWTYIGDLANPYVVYTYTPDRSWAGPHTFLAEFKGYLQADAYGGYDGIYGEGQSPVRHKGDCVEGACWAHARRKFFDPGTTDGVRAAAMLTMVKELSAIEHEAREMTDDARRALRQEKNVPILAKVKAWLDEQSKLVLPRSPMAGAITYTLNQWKALCRYCEQGFLNINDAAERALKRAAISGGRTGCSPATTSSASSTPRCGL